MVATGADPAARPGVLTDLTETERALIDAARRGRQRVCSRLEVDELRTSTSPDHLVRARLLRELLLGWHGDLDPRGVRLTGARVTGEFDANHVKADVGLVLHRCVIDQSAQFRRARLPWLTLTGCNLSVLDAQGLRVEGDLILTEGFAATGTGEHGAVRLLDAHITGSLDLSTARLTNDTGPALNADRLQVDGGLFLQEGFTAVGTGEFGAVRMLGAHITGQLSLSTARLTNGTGPALYADGLRVDGDLFLRNGLTATGAGELGAVRLLGAAISGNAEFDGAQLSNVTGPALGADRLRVDGDLFLREGFTATGEGEHSAVRLPGAHITGSLDLSTARLTNDTGPALGADRLRVDGSLFLREGFTATGEGEHSAVRLLGAHITGRLDLSTAQLSNKTGPTLNVANARCSLLVLPASVMCPSGRREVSRTCPDSDRVIGLNGFTYTDLAEVSWGQWLHLLRHHTSDYRPQPYQQLAAVRTAAGHDRDSRQILIVQQQDHRVRGDLGGPLRRTLHATWGALGGYGYRTGRIALALLAVLALAGALGVWAGNTPTTNGQHAAQRPPQPSTQPTQPVSPPATTTSAPAQCSLVEQIGLGIDRGLPLASTGVRTRCDLDTTSTAGQWFTATIWLLQATLWALATLAIAGYTNLVRKVR
ncbi:hypothetical protein [Kibdelosporangium persicum]|uniref:hypothetical protein n=1 Tax=Kibdelosporangium persicum TaxID=2698649 RepID=UPI001563B18A|nr:hypothetical protein [Kibdelosporangium persicum]